jgi:hypothetical protein
MSEEQLEILLHVGPPKTATTALQDFLAFHKNQLLDLGVFYATSANKTAAHHLPFALLGWNPWIIGLPDEEFSIDEALDSMLSEALDKNCQKVLISSESFTQLNDQMWQDFSMALQGTNAMKLGRVASIRIIYTNRDIADRTLSDYAESLKHGAKYDFKTAEPLIRKEYSDADSRLRNLQNFFTIPVVNQQIEFEDQGSGSGFIERWITQVIGPKLSEQVASFDFKSSANQRDSEAIQQKLLEFNRLNSPESRDVWRPFILRSDFSPELEKGWIRLRLYHHFLIESARKEGELGPLSFAKDLQLQIDSLREQNTAYAESLSWRITKPLRWLGKLFQIAKKSPRSRS